MRRVPVVLITGALLAVPWLTGCGSDSPTETTPVSPTSRADAPVPDVLGQRPAKAQQLIQEAGFRIVVHGRAGQAPNGSQCVVIEQDPQPGAVLPPGTTVTVRTGGTTGPDSPPGDPAAAC
ncbi:PASTA domain-containing protein [Nocardia sp. NPDC024068]|uniref:PASTA domain-containing protein n=1 Tax=Nocardia sp. NPDC024068 TaxID=3157197 RepID=UPI0033F8223E